MSKLTESQRDILIKHDYDNGLSYAKLQKKYHIGHKKITKIVGPYVKYENRLTKEEIIEIKYLKNQGLSCRQLCKRFHLSHLGLLRVLSK